MFSIYITTVLFTLYIVCMRVRTRIILSTESGVEQHLFDLYES